MSNIYNWIQLNSAYLDAASEVVGTGNPTWVCCYVILNMIVNLEYIIFLDFNQLIYSCDVNVT